MADSSTMTRRHLLGLALGSGLALVAAACGGASQPASSGSNAPAPSGDLATYQGADRQQRLEEGARKEGNVTWYTSLSGPVVDALANGFKAKYPFIQVNVFRATEDQLIPRVTQEAQAGKPLFDALESPISAGLLLGDAKLLQPYFSPALTRVPDALKVGASGSTVMGATVRLAFFSFGYNTTLLPESAVPKKVEDLASPALTGKLSIGGTASGYRWIGALLQTMGDDKAKAFLKQMAAQKVSVQQLSGAALMDLVAKGEAPGSLTIFRDHLAIAAEKGAPVKWLPLQPVVANVGNAWYAAKPPHPNAGMLFVDYLLTDGQAELQKANYSLPTDKMDFDYLVLEHGRTASQLSQDLTTWTDLFKATFRG